jgi:quinoprotein glucose dehydrogenase
VAYDTGTTLTDEWRKTLLVASFPGAASNARIHALSLQPQGAGFTLANDRVLLQGILTVGMRFGPDGALYLADWITGWDSKNKGRIWKVDGPNAAASPMRIEVKKLLGENLGSRTPADVARLMRHADVRVRQKAQFDLVRRGDAPTLLASANNREHQLARIHAIWGIAQLARKDAQQASALVPFLEDEDVEIRAQAAKMLGDVRYAPAAEALTPLLKDGAPRVRFFAAEALGRIAHKPAAGALVAMLADNNDQDVYLRHAGSVALFRIGDAAALAALDKHPSGGVRIAAVIALRRLRSAEVARFLADADDQVVTEAARAINDDGGIEAALPALARTLGESRFTGEPLLRRAISANLRVGTSDAVTRVAAFAADRARTEELRAEAIGALSVWPAPSPMDRVDGFYIGQPAPRDGAAARAAVLGLFDAIGNAGDATTDIKIAMAEAAGRLGVTEVAPVLLKQLQGDQSSQVRLASLRALQAIKVPNMDEVMTIAFGDSDATVRRAALAVLPDLSIPSAAKVQHLATVMKTGSLSDRQGALEVLGTLRSPEATKVLGTYLTELTAGKTPPELQIDVLDAVEASGSQPLTTRVETYVKSRKAETVTDAFPEALLRGGNMNRGRLAFSQHPAAECTRCHTVRGRGTDVGPNLTTVGATLSREQLLEALLQPNARIAPGFGTLSLTLQNGDKIVGTLREETGTHLILMVGTPPVEQRIAKTDVKERANPTSAMPPMGLLLKPREIRDLVEFLSTLR